MEDSDEEEPITVESVQTEDELKRYLALPQEKLEHDHELLQWWENHEK